MTFGALISQRPLHQTELAHRILAGTFCEAFTIADARLSAQVRADRRRLGKAIAPLDAMIAAQALSRAWAMVTADEDDFASIPGLSVINWRKPPATVSL